VIARNLLGRLNARTPDDLQRIATAWVVPLPGGDRGRHVGALYRTMTDIRYARSMWDRLDPASRRIVHDFAAGDGASRTVEEIAALTSLRPADVRSAVLSLFHAGILSREGDNQELPVGVLPKLFLPREVGLVFRRVQDEIDAGDLSGTPLRVLLETLDDAELEEAATTWGIRVIPGQRRRADLVSQIMRQVASPERVDQIAGARGHTAKAIWVIVKEAAPDPVPFHDALWRAGLGPPKPADPTYVRGWNRIETALAELESTLLVFHTWRRDDSRWLFVPPEIARPGEAARTLSLRPLQPLPEDKAPIPRDRPIWGVAWDLLTVLREIAEHGAPVWVPGEPLARSWQRRLNRRLWFAGDEVPPIGYLGFLLHLGVAVDVITPSTEQLPTGTDRGAVRPTVSPTVREWTRHGFAAQDERLRRAWIDGDAWIEGRERGEIEIWGADWRGFRERLLKAVAGFDPSEWLLIEDVGARLAEQHGAIIGPTFTAASARAVRNGLDERTAAIAQVIEVEIETALTWFGVVQVGTAPRSGLAMRRVAEPETTGKSESGPALEISESGLITLLRPAPIHVWSLSAFADAESLRPKATYQLRPGSVSRALGAGFGLEQIVSYLEAQGGGPIPAQLATHLRDWTVGYRRVRMRRAMVFLPDAPESIPDLRALLQGAGLTVLETPTPDGAIVAILEPGGDPAAATEESVQALLRANGFAGQWQRALQTGSGPRG
jgi:hypothetical protein